jgi:hypothetical protein
MYNSAQVEFIISTQVLTCGTNTFPGPLSEYELGGASLIKFVLVVEHHGAKQYLSSSSLQKDNHYSSHNSTSKSYN